MYCCSLWHTVYFNLKKTLLWRTSIKRTPLIYWCIGSALNVPALNPNASLILRLIWASWLRIINAVPGTIFIWSTQQNLQSSTITCFTWPPQKPTTWQSTTTEFVEVKVSITITIVMCYCDILTVDAFFVWHGSKIGEHRVQIWNLRSNLWNRLRIGLIAEDSKRKWKHNHV